MRITKDPEVRRAELIAAARELFDKNGIENTQVSQIVKKVGVAQGLFYYYFRSKEDVVNQVIQIVMGEINEQAEEIVQSSEKSFIEKLNSYIRLYLDLIDQFSGDSEKDLHSMLDIIGQNPIAKQAHQLDVYKRQLIDNSISLHCLMNSCKISSRLVAQTSSATLFTSSMALVIDEVKIAKVLFGKGLTSTTDWISCTNSISLVAAERVSLEALAFSTEF